MKDLIQYNYWFYRIFHQYFKDYRLDIVLHSLEMMEKKSKEETGKNTPDSYIWFRLHENDTLVTDITSIKKDLSLPKRHNNRKYTEDLLRDCIKNASVKIYLS